MMYFKIVSLLLGTTLLFFGAAYFFSKKSWVSFFSEKLWAESGPVMILPLFIIHVVLSLAGWMICLGGYRHPLAYFISGLLTLGAAKLGCVLPIYKQFRKVMALLVTTEKFACVIFSTGSMVIGTGFIVLGAMLQ